MSRISVGLICLLAAILSAEPALGFSSEKASFAIRIRGEINPYKVLGVYVLPGEILEIAVQGPARPGDAYTFTATGGEGIAREHRKLRWAAPRKTGLQQIRIERAGTGDTMELAVFVMTPLRELTGEKLNGYRIGRYPEKPLRGLEIYRPPRGFVEVTAENAATRISPHFELGQFVCKQAGGYPKYVVIRERLLLKLEYLLELVNRKGFPAETFAVLSGYRTPFYNHAIGNVKYSRHQWGGAADIFIDVDPKDDLMDDLDGNGKIDVRDADLLYELFDAEPGKAEYEPFIGGLGLYGNTRVHGPFVHVDARGFRARWGR